MCLRPIKVVKRDGREEDFVPEKIVVSVLKAGGTPEAARKAAIVVTARLLEEGRESVTTKEITKMVLDMLRRENREWFDNWVIYDRVVKRRRTDVEVGAPGGGPRPPAPPGAPSPP